MSSVVNSHAAIVGDTSSVRKVQRALVSVFNKDNIVELGQFLSSAGVEILSTGGTAKKLIAAGIPVTAVDDYTGSPEILNGRVKTLHPKIHGGILAVRGNAVHEADMETHGVKPIDMVVVNLYPFQQTVAKEGIEFLTAMENVDIGGPTMLRAAAKNNAAVMCVTSPDQYGALMESMKANDGCTTYDMRKTFAAAAFAHSASYDAAINEYFSKTLRATAPIQNRQYKEIVQLKYGCNPHQKPASLNFVDGNESPFTILNGRPGYINLLDAANAWQLVLELKRSLDMPSAASFKHVSPAGAAVAVPLTPEEVTAYEVAGKNLTPLALAYLRARNADPMSSFGDFAAVSDVVDEATAMVLKTVVSDGIVAPGFEPKALEILKGKKKGAFIILQADPSFKAPELEYREVFGMGFMQKRNTELITKAKLGEPTTATKDLPDEARRDLVVASIALKYTQSNSVGYAKNGQMVGVGAGQQSRVDCVKLAGRKVNIWALRQHPKVMSLKFKSTVKKQERINARVRYIEGDITDVERKGWESQFEAVPEPLTEAEKKAFMGAFTGVSLSSDAFFPFRDNIDHASKYGVQFVAQPGGSRQDGAVTEACNEYGMVQCHHGVRLFHH
eukprot:g1281.t1